MHILTAQPAVAPCMALTNIEAANWQCRWGPHWGASQRCWLLIDGLSPLPLSCHLIPSADDRQKLCRDIPDGMAQVFMCLQEKMGDLQTQCRRAIFHQV